MKIEHCPRPILQDAVLTQLYHVVRHRGVDYTGSDINLALEAFKRALAVQPQILAEPPFPRIAPYLWSFYIGLQKLGEVQSALIANWNRRKSAEYQNAYKDLLDVMINLHDIMKQHLTCGSMRSVPLSPVPKTSDFQGCQEVNETFFFTLGPFTLSNQEEQHGKMLS
ncbi:unnamed protein product [Somion occarium]|uniref:Uncharacterized protein n=1 Tax=Somion occarium TaxID=3059160 RepID=A0ABP1CU36_9APHY